MKRYLRMFEEVLIRLILIVAFTLMERKDLEPFQRVVHQNEYDLYGHPKTKDYFPGKYLWCMVFIVPILSVLIVQAFQKRKEDSRIVDLKNAILCITLLMPLNGVVTNIIKFTVGRPRPDFFFRCWPEAGYPEDVSVFQIHNDGTQDLKCTGDLHIIAEGRKSFPSGHSSFSFSTFGFVFFYVCGKLNVFSPRQRLKESTFLLCLSCLLAPLLIAISRTCDYHHHWQDVTVGSIMGLVLAYTCYRLYYPRLSITKSHLPLDCFSNNIYEHGEYEESLLPSYKNQIHISKNYLMKAGDTIH